MPKCFHLAGGDQIFDDAGDVLHWRVGVDAVLVKQIDAVGLQPLQRSFRYLSDMLGPAVDAG
jgi:hypothetical protein